MLMNSCLNFQKLVKKVFYYQNNTECWVTIYNYITIVIRRCLTFIFCEDFAIKYNNGKK